MCKIDLDSLSESTVVSRGHCTQIKLAGVARKTNVRTGKIIMLESI